MAVGDIITAARYNNLQSRVATIMGVGSADDGYGQTLNSSQVGVTDKVTATHMALLFNDIVAGRIHQTNITPSNIALISGADLIEDSNTVNKKGVAQYENRTGELETEKNNIDVNQASAESGIQGQYTTPWNGQLDHIVNVTFTGSDHARHFFNSGGQVRLNANIAYVGTEEKTVDWMNILANMAQIQFGASSTLATGTGSGEALKGYFQLTTSYQTLFTKQGTGDYTENSYVVEVKGNTVPYPDIVTFRLNFNDDDPTDPGTPTDETVKGTLTSIVSQFRATGVNVEVPTPTYANDAGSNLT